jgi:hypothetical protein
MLSGTTFGGGHARGAAVGAPCVARVRCLRPRHKACFRRCLRLHNHATTIDVHNLCEEVRKGIGRRAGSSGAVRAVERGQLGRDTTTACHESSHRVAEAECQAGLAQLHNSLQGP